MKKYPDTLNSRKKRMIEIISVLSAEYPSAQIQLHYSNPFELLVATILSAQCTDNRVNIVTKPLFQKYRKPRDYISVSAEELEKDIYSTGFYRAKASNIKKASKKILEVFGGQVPGTMEELLSLPGVGRKTANVILGHVFGVPGIVVDTHVIRISARLGFANTRNPDKIEFSLMEISPKKDWVIMTHYFILHGRKICGARNAKCQECGIAHLCPSAELV